MGIGLANNLKLGGAGERAALTPRARREVRARAVEQRLKPLHLREIRSLPAPEVD